MKSLFLKVTIITSLFLSSSCIAYAQKIPFNQFDKGKRETIEKYLHILLTADFNDSLINKLFVVVGKDSNDYAKKKEYLLFDLQMRSAGFITMLWGNDSLHGISEIPPFDFNQIKIADFITVKKETKVKYGVKGLMLPGEVCYVLFGDHIDKFKPDPNPNPDFDFIVLSPDNRISAIVVNRQGIDFLSFHRFDLYEGDISKE